MCRRVRANRVASSFNRLVAGHSQYSETLATHVCSELDALAKEEAKKRSATVNEQAKVDKAWKAQLAVMKKAELAYKEAAAAADAAFEAFVQGKQDADMKPKELTKLSARSTKANELRDKAQAEYRRVLQLTNQQKTIFWCQEMPAVLRKYQQHEEERVDQTKGIVEKLGHAFLFKPPIYQSSAEALIRAADAIDKKADVKALVEKHGSSFAAPGDYPEQHFGGETGGSSQPPAFDAASAATVASATATAAAAAAAAPSSSSVAPPPIAKPNKGGRPPPLPSKAGVGGSSEILTRCTGLAALPAGLSDAEKTAQLSEQLEALEKAMLHETKAKKGLEALIGFYKDDPVAKKKAEVEVADAQSKLAAISERVKQLDGEIKGLQGGARARGSTMIGSAPPAANLPTIERLQALFDYEATSGEELSFKEGDWLEIKQKDESGWWWASTTTGAKREGFIPKDYVVPE